MIKKTVSYEDFDGNQQTETLYFNISKSEAVEINVSTWFKALIGKVTNADGTVKKDADQNDTVQAFKKLVGFAYGTRTADAKRFHKDPEQSADFLSSPAYDALFMDLFTGDTARISEFIFGMVPADLANQAQQIGTGVKVNVPDPNPPALPITNVVLPPAPTAAPATDPAVPNAFAARKSSFAAQRHGHGPQRHAAGTEPDPAAPAPVETSTTDSTAPAPVKPLDQMSEDELTAELTRRRAAKAAASATPAS